MSSPSETLAHTAELAEAHRLALKRLREMGMEIAGKLHAQSQAPDAELGDIATKFARVARAVRQTIALESKLAEEAHWRAHEAKALEVSRRQPDPPEWIQRLGVRRAECYRRQAENKLEAMTLVRRAMAKTPGLDRDLLDERLTERLDRDPYDNQFDIGQDLTETIGGICRDLGLDPDWNGFTELDWRQVSRETRSALTGAPLETLPAALHNAWPEYTLPPRTMPVRSKGQRFDPLLDDTSATAAAAAAHHDPPRPDELPNHLKPRSSPPKLMWT